MAQILNVEQGVVYSFKAKFSVAGPGDQYRFRVALAYDQVPLIELDETDGIVIDVDDFAEIVMTSEHTALLKAPEYKYQLDLISGAEVIQRQSGIIKTDGTFNDA